RLAVLVLPLLVFPRPELAVELLQAFLDRRDEVARGRHEVADVAAGHGAHPVLAVEDAAPGSAVHAVTGPLHPVRGIGHVRVPRGQRWLTELLVDVAHLLRTGVG